MNSFACLETPKYLLGVIMFYLYWLYVGTLCCCGCRMVVWTGITEDGVFNVIGVEGIYMPPVYDLYMWHGVLCLL